ncbi:MAG: membrane integrity-associated transporter subunit PqiC [Desulfovibrionaceae bacterium]|nr:membrane integrity-associated transporter subunit PqiC [Desulfovibrionaceae bacterium]
MYALSPQLPGSAPEKLNIQLAVSLPSSDEMLAGNRIVTRYPSGELRAWKGVAWVAAVPMMFQQQLIAGYENTGLFTALPADAAGFNPDYRLLLDIRRFDIVLDDNEKPVRVQVKTAAHLMDLQKGTSLGYLNSDKSVELSPESSFDDVLAAFNEALGESIAEICTWSEDVLIPVEKRRS